MYFKTVIAFQRSNYKTIDNLIERSPNIMKDNKWWICKTCHKTLKRGLLPAQSIANRLDIDDTPLELRDLNPLEIRLIALRIPFMKMVALPCGKQRCIHGPAVNVPADLHPVCSLLPRLPSESQIVPFKLKRKLCYKGHYMYEFVRPKKILEALQWLKSHNPLYNNIVINNNWLNDAAMDDADLLTALLPNNTAQAMSPTVSLSICEHSK